MTAAIAVDIGGTFTDIVLEEGSRRVTIKTPTTPSAPAEGVMEGLSRVLGEAGLSASDITLLLHGTTLATNAILERKGAVTALVTTAGFRDVLEIGYETRFDQYDLMIEKPAPLVPRPLRFAVEERVDVYGNVRTPLSEAGVKTLVPQLEAAGVKSVAVAYLHGYANDAHEQRTAEILYDLCPDLSISLASKVSPEIREYERFTTASADAYVKPLMRRYLADLDERLHAAGFSCPTLMMTSGGGLCSLSSAADMPIRLVESGPAGGAIFARTIAEDLDLPKTLSFDMGGTTAKICLLSEFRPQMSRDFEVDRSERYVKGSGLPLRIPVIEMVEIGAGGGSIAKLDAMRRIQVGPDSAGADPGPAAFGKGGTAPTVSDADIVLGRVPLAHFAGGDFTLEPDRAVDALEKTIGAPLAIDATAAAIGVSEVVDEAMASAARRHTIERGFDASDHTLVAFGGAAPLHACRLAQKLGIARVVVPPDAGVGSAVGFLRAPISFEQVKSLRVLISAFEAEAVNELFGHMRQDALAVVRAGAPDGPLTERRTAYMRYVGQGHEIPVPVTDGILGDGEAQTLRTTYEAAYARQFRRVIPNAEIEVLSWGLALQAERPGASVGVDGNDEGDEAVSDAAAPAPKTLETGILIDPVSGKGREVPLYQRENLTEGSLLEGPLLVAERQTTTNVPEGFFVRVAPSGALILEAQP
ncbi:MAG: hydantoinase/oxoprolinase family protein [Pseudomonadota bacterium]